MDYLKMKENADRLGVTPEVYQFLRQSNRKMRYFTCDLKKDTFVIEGDKLTVIPSREDSLDQLEKQQGYAFAAEEKSVEDIVEEHLLLEQLRYALTLLEDGERHLIEEIFFNGRTQREISKTIGITQPAVKKRCDNAIAKLKKIMGI